MSRWPTCEICGQGCTDDFSLKMHTASKHPTPNAELRDWIDALLENYGGLTPIGEYRHTYNCPDRNLDAPACQCMTPEEAKEAILEKLLMERLEERKAFKEQLNYVATLNSKNKDLTPVSDLLTLNDKAIAELQKQIKGDE